MLAAGRLKPATSSSIPSSASGGTKTMNSAKSTICELVEPRIAKNSGFLLRMSSKGCASAKPESTASCAPLTSAVRRKLC